MIELVEVRETNILNVPSVVVVRYVSGFEKEIFSGPWDDCVAFADRLFGDVYGMNWKPSGAINAAGAVVKPVV